jgi:amino acid adenylation domain-containing protein
MNGSQQEIIEGFRVSPQQKHLWLLQQEEPRRPYCAQCAVLIEGNLDTKILAAALRNVFDRHEILRTTFICLPGMSLPVQVISGGSIPSIDGHDLTGWGAGEQRARIEALFQEASLLPFDFEKGPLARVSLVALSPDKFMLLVTLSSLCADAASLDTLVRELGRAYSASVRGEELCGEPMQYADLAEWQNELLESAETRAGREYWRKRNSAALLDLRLPFERQISGPSDVAHFDPRYLTATITPAATAKIRTLLRKYDAPASAFFLACWQTLLWRLTGLSDFIVGIACDGRTYEGLPETIGPLAKYLPLRCHLQNDLRFSEFLAQVNESARDVAEWQEYFSWEQIAGSNGDIKAPPFFSTSFEFAEQPAGCSAPAVKLSIHRRLACADRFKLKLSCVQRDDFPTVELHYDAHLYRVEDIGRFAGQYQTLLESVVRDPEAAISELEIVSAAERRQLLVEFNDTRTDFPEDRCIQQLFEEQVERAPDNIAVVFEDRQLTFAQLNARANQLAHYLRTLGVGPEVLVAICLERSLEMVIGLLGILKAGGAYVPLDPAYPKERLADLLADTQAPVLLTQQRVMAEVLEDRGPRIEDGDSRSSILNYRTRVVCLDTEWQAIARESEENALTSASAGNAAYVIYTSGSTGQPKGVVIEHRGLSNTLNWLTDILELSAKDRGVLKTPITFDAAGREIFPTLMAGGTLVIAETDGHRDSRYLAEMIGNQRLSIFHCVPSLLRLLLEEPALAGAGALRAVMCGGEALPPQVVMRFQRRSGAKLYNVYGPTEAIIDSTYWLCEGVGAHSTIPIGRPIANARIYILDEALRPLPPGVPGELYIGGVSLARGYLNRPELTAEKFVPNPFGEEPGARLYKTGDLARYLPDGNIEFLGRADHQVKIRGFRIEPGEIEAALDQHPAVREAVVLAREDTPGEKRLVAYVVAEQGPVPTTAELRSFLKDKLPEHMVPALFVVLDALPLMPNGKVDRRALPMPDRARPELEKAFVAPRDDLELQLAQIWEEVLGVRPVGVRDNFFELGGHSLLAVRLFAIIEKRLGRKLPLTTVFQGATVEHLAGVLRQQAKPGPQSCLVTIKPDGGKRPLFLVHPAGGHVFPYIHLAQYLDPDQPCYGLQARGLEEGQEPHTRIEDMAAYYIEALQTVQPAGPYLLGGWSMGGVVAFEMAQQLHAQGHRVALLALLDGRIPTADETFPEEDYEAVLLVERYFGISFGPMESLAQLPKDEQLAFMLEQAKSAGLVPAELDVAEARRFVELLKSDLRATQHYALHPYPGRVTLFKASEELAGASPDPTLGWSEWANAGVEVHLVPGNHANLVYEPHVEVLAEKLSACLSRALSAEEGFTQSQSTDPMIKEVQ